MQFIKHFSNIAKISSTLQILRSIRKRTKLSLHYYYYCTLLNFNENKKINNKVSVTSSNNNKNNDNRKKMKIELNNFEEIFPTLNLPSKLAYPINKKDSELFMKWRIEHIIGRVKPINLEQYKELYEHLSDERDQVISDIEAVVKLFNSKRESIFCASSIPVKGRINTALLLTFLIIFFHFLKYRYEKNNNYLQ